SAHCAVRPNALVDLGLDRRDILRGHGVWVTEVETQAIGGYERALLRDMLAQPPAERLVQQMCHRVVGAQLAPPNAVDPQLDGIAGSQHPAGDTPEMNVKVARLLYRVAHPQLSAGTGKDDTGIADLSACFCVERRLVDDQRNVVSDGGLGNAFAAPQDCQHNALGALGLVAEKLSGADVLAQAEPDRLGRRLARADPALARLLALPCHR